MGIIVNKEQNDSELERRIDADLRARAATSSLEANHLEAANEYLKETKHTSRFAWVWPVLIFLALLSIILIIFI